MKEIWKKHYEKVVLGALALSFVFALLYLLQMLDTASTEDQLRFRKVKAAYEIKDFAADDYQVDYKLGKLTVLAKRAKSDKVAYSSELLIPMKALRCNKCKKILPWEMSRRRNNQNAHCPHCDEELEDPGDPKDYASEVALRDSDGDGMPDRYERRMRLDFMDEKDALTDKDGDGFSNLYEYIAGTDPNDKSNYPSLAKCLYLSKISKVKLPLKLESAMRIDDGKDPAKAVWNIALYADKEYKSLSLGEEFTLRKKTYKVLRVDAKIIEKQEGGVVNKYDDHTVVLALVVNGKVDDKNLIMLRKNEPVYDREPTVTIRDVRNKKRYTGSNGKSFEVTTEDGKRIKFIIVATDQKAQTVTLEDTEVAKTSQKREDAFIVLKLIKNQKSLESAYTRQEGSGDTSSSAGETPQKKKKKKTRKKR